MYRHPHVAAHAQIETLRGDLSRLRADLEAAERARRDAERALEHAREGVEPDPDLEFDATYVWARRGLVALGNVGVVVAIAGLVPLLQHTVADARLDAQGVANFVWHMQHGRGWVGLAATLGVLVIGAPWIALPLLGAIGLRRSRRAGWFFAVAGSALYLPTPLAPLAVLALAVLLSGRVRRVYFPAGRR